MRRRNLEKASAFWKAAITKRVVRRGYEHKPVDDEKVKREAEAARELMKDMTR